MKSGIFDHVERRRDVPLDRQYRQRIDLLSEADRGGIYGYHVAEHHHSPLSTVPSQAPYLAAIAARTEHIRCGPLVYVSPLYHPIHAGAAYEVYRANFTKPLPGGKWRRPKSMGSAIRKEEYPWDADFATARQREAVLVGSPTTVRDYVQHYAAESSCNYFVASFQWGDVTHEEALRSLRLFIAEVMPHAT